MAGDGCGFKKFHCIGADIGDKAFHRIIGAHHGPDDGIHFIQQFIGGVGYFFQFQAAFVPSFCF